MAFQTNNWNLKNTLLPNQEEISGVKEKMQNIAGSTSLENYVYPISLDRSEQEVSSEINFTSPFEEEMKPLESILIENIRLEISDKAENNKIVTLVMEESVEIGPGESERFNLSGTPTPEGKDFIADTENMPLHELLDIIKITGGIVRLEVAGVEIELPSERFKGALL